jgi:hypothetical protein
MVLAQMAAAQDATAPAPAAAPAAQTAEPAAAPVATPEAAPAATPEATPQTGAATPQPAAAAVPTPEAAAQTTEPTATPAPTPATEPAAAVPAPADAPAGQATIAPAATPSTTPAKPVGMNKGPAKKVEYTGPTTVIVLAPTPMLDGEGKQRLDPDGKPMFNPPVSQQRDKKGHPLFDEQNKPVFQTATELGYDEHGHHLHIQKEKPPKMTPVTISRGTFTVDGMIGKAELNYDIADLKFIYLYAPIIGTVVVSNVPFEGAKEEPNAFADTTLTVTVGDHILQVASDKRLLGKKPEPAYVLLDREFKLPSKYPVVGYGATLKAPYAWPGGRPNPVTEATIQPPPVPENLRPVMLLSPCPAGEMRKPAPAVLPGQTAPEQPCVSIEKVVPTQTVAGKTTPAAPTVGPTTPAATAPGTDPAKTGSPQ